MLRTDAGLHPLATKLPTAEIHFTLRNALRGGDQGLLECVYRARREWDVHKKRYFHLLGSIWRIGSRDWMTTQREETYTTRTTLHAVDGVVKFAVPLRAADPTHRAYQLAEVRLGDFEFSRWFVAAPALDPGFGLAVDHDSLRGCAATVGLGAEPLRGDLPLWPDLRRVELEVRRERAPSLQLCDPVQRRHSDGWRYSTPAHWPGGRSILARHIDAPTVWWCHDYFAVAPSREPAIARPVPPEGTVPGVALDLFWPSGAELEFPEARFESAIDVLRMPVAALTPRARDHLATAATLRPGQQLGTLPPEAWREFEELADRAEQPAIDFEMRAVGDESHLFMSRRVLTEPWLTLFGSEVPALQCVAVVALIVHPQAWAGQLPE